MSRFSAIVLCSVFPSLVHAEEHAPHPSPHANESHPPQVAVLAGGGVIVDDHLTYESSMVLAGVSGSFLLAPRIKLKVEGGPGIVVSREFSPAAYLQVGPAYVFSEHFQLAAYATGKAHAHHEEAEFLVGGALAPTVVAEHVFITVPVGMQTPVGEHGGHVSPTVFLKAGYIFGELTSH